MKEDEMSEKYKKALRIAVNVGCGFEGDAEDAAELLTLITGLESRIAELEAAQRWIPVSERLPEHGDFVLTWDNEIIEVLKYIRTFGGEWFIDIADAAVYPTHWMPLPEPPNDTQTDTFVYGKESEE